MAPFPVAPPQLVDSTPSQMAVINDSVKLMCIFSGNFTPSVVWLFNGVDTESSGLQFSINNSVNPFGQLVSVLVVPVASESHSGDYICLATNLLGSNQSSNISLIVRESDLKMCIIFLLRNHAFCLTIFVNDTQQAH